MTAAVLGRTEIGVREFGSTVTIPSDPRAKLMYYLDCICVVLDMNDQQNLTRLRNFSNYNSLTEQETDALVALCFLLSPDDLTGKVLFQDDDMCGDSSNQFFELSAVQSNVLVVDSIIIGGQQRAVHNIMAVKQQWLVSNWVSPMQHFTPRLARIARGESSERARPAIAYGNETSSRRSSGCCCAIL